MLVITFMFVLNQELILHGINSWSHGILLFLMALIGIAAFENVAQGWCIVKNKLYEIPFFRAAAFILFHPGAVASFFNISQSQKYYMYFLGIFIYSLVIANQAVRKKRTVDRSRLTQKPDEISQSARIKTINCSQALCAY